MTKQKWNANNIPDQKGRIAIITGASSGLGKEATRILATKNARVILAVRNIKKGESVANEIRGEFPEADLHIRHLDLSSLESVNSFAERMVKELDHLDILINNAGVMMIPYSETQDGFELQMGTNHLGHFALTGLLMPLLKKTKGSRIVATSSMAHQMGNIDLSDLNWKNRKYNKYKAYGDSKLANLYFIYELSKKLQNEVNGPTVTVAHPGWTRTDLQQHSGFFNFMNPFLSQGIEIGTLPTLRAAIDEQAQAGDYYGPSGFMEMRGHPVKVKSNKRSKDEEIAQKFWQLSEEMTGVSY